MKKRKDQDLIIDFEEARAARRKKRERLAEKKTRNSEAQSVRKNGARIFAKLYVLAVLVIVAAVGVFSLQIAALQMDLAEAQAENDEVSLKKAKLQNELENIDDAEYIEQQARSRLHMIKPGELLYVLPEEAHMPEEDNIPEGSEYIDSGGDSDNDVDVVENEDGESSAENE